MTHPRTFAKVASLAVIAIGSLALGSIAGAATACDRACLRGHADRVLAAMVAHDPARLPLANPYMATENSVPTALGMMTVFNTAVATRGNYYVIDPQTQQTLFVTTVSEAAGDLLLFGRLLIRDSQLAELELYTLRSRGEGGFQYSATALANMPAEWTTPIPAAQRASRAALLEAGRSIFDTRVKAPDIAPACVIMENGKVVAEDAEMAKSLAPPGAPDGPPAQTNADGTVAIHCGNPPERPTDARARTDIVDEEQGVVVSIATVNGVVQPYLVKTPTESAFVPDSMATPYTGLLKQQRATGKYTVPAIRPMAATQVVVELHRVYDNKLQGLMMLQSLGAPGSASPWVR